MGNANGQPDPPGDETYRLEGEIEPPDLRGDVVCCVDADETIDRLAADLVVHAQNCVREFGDFHVALSGDPALEPLYLRLMYDPDFRRLPWRRTHLWLVHECCVPFDDRRSTYRLVRELVGDHADIPSEQFHVIFPESDAAADEYEAQIREALEWREKGQDRLDYALLVLGPDGGTAGFDPRTGNGHDDDEQLVRHVRAPVTGEPDRVTLTIPFLNAARFIAVFAVGEARAAAVRRLVETNDVASDAMPISSISPVSGELKWYLDAEARGGVSSPT